MLANTLAVISVVSASVAIGLALYATLQLTSRDRK